MKKRLIKLLIFLGLISAVILRAQQIKPKMNFSSISQQTLIKNSRITWQGNLPAINADQQFLAKQTLKILAIRVDFIKDEDLKTTGDGRFIMNKDEKQSVDPAPHDLSYFKHQLDALANYYKSVSSGLLQLETDVAPAVFTLPHEMSYYSPAFGKEKDDIQLARLFYDAISAADAAGTVFSNYDCFLVFHAGVGKDISLGYDSTPSDIPSAFLSKTDLNNRLAENVTSQGIPVENGTFFVQEGIILPETENQDGYEVGLLGTMTLMFGFQLGLPALWDVDTGRSGIGRWGLMDQGSGNYNGLIPARPSAWTRIFLGWEKPVVIRTGIDAVISTSAGSKHPTIYKVPINPHEYFLIENRQYDINQDSSAYGLDAGGQTVRFRPDGRIEAPGPIEVIISVDEYDYGLPGSGLLIWHIDEEIILKRLATNRLNTGDEKGIDLEEADGAQDIGESYGMFNAGGGSENGVLHDAWFAKNEIHLLANGSKEVIFDTDTYPNSRSNAGADSHIRISSFSASDSLMTFTVQNNLVLSGFPLDFGPDKTPYSPLYGDFTGDGQTELIVATREGDIFACQDDGSVLWANGQTAIRSCVGGDTLHVNLPLVYQSKAAFPVPPVLTSNNGSAGECIVAVDSLGRLIIVKGRDENNDGWGDIKAIIEDAIPSVSALALFNHTILVGSKNGQLKAFSQNGKLVWQTETDKSGVTGLAQCRDLIIVSTGLSGFRAYNMAGKLAWSQTNSFSESLRSPVAAKAASPLTGRTLLVGLKNELGIVMDMKGNEKNKFGVYQLPEDAAGPALGDLDGDGRIEIVLTGAGKFWVFHENGSFADFFPQPNIMRNINLSAPVLGDIDGDGKVDIIAAGSDGNIDACSINGQSIAGFPLSTGGHTAVSPVLLDLDGDGDIELAAVSDEGYLHVWDLAAVFNETAVPWGSNRHDPQGTAQLYFRYRQPSEPGKMLMPKNLVYNYPNPAVDGFTTIRYHLEKTADVTIYIYDLTGHLRARFKGKGVAGVDNEVTWDLADVDSGVYYCEVKAKAEKEEVIVRFRIGVVK